MGLLVDGQDVGPYRKHAECLDQVEQRVLEVEDEQVCIVGLVESTNAGHKEALVEQMLFELLWRETFSVIFAAEYAHCFLTPQPVPGSQPCSIIDILLNYHDRDGALR
ncbi:hypothetical protein NDU88_004682 [Pleurodeles waltl]|uniref:Uncharacterized protein n=1 Tax=Pleurodeles waltl TaxID=8319 RepID=A0AAV7VKI9_PLEWA|nr:hypothetical protein NDU88_004682 [Pleurodeles waltl]